MVERAKFDFGNTGPEMTFRMEDMVIDKTGRRKLNSCGNAIRIKNNPMLLWGHKNRMFSRPIIEESVKAAREHFNEIILNELDAYLKA